MDENNNIVILNPTSFVNLYNVIKSLRGAKNKHPDRVRRFADLLASAGATVFQQAPAGGEDDVVSASLSVVDFYDKLVYEDAAGDDDAGAYLTREQQDSVLRELFARDQISLFRYFAANHPLGLLARIEYAEAPPPSMSPEYDLIAQLAKTAAAAAAFFDDNPGAAELLRDLDPKSVVFYALHENTCLRLPVWQWLCSNMGEVHLAVLKPSVVQHIRAASNSSWRALIDTMCAFMDDFSDRLISPWPAFLPQLKRTRQLPTMQLINNTLKIERSSEWTRVVIAPNSSVVIMNGDKTHVLQGVATEFNTGTVVQRRTLYKMFETVFSPAPVAAELQHFLKIQAPAGMSTCADLFVGPAEVGRTLFATARSLPQQPAPEFIVGYIFSAFVIVRAVFTIQYYRVLHDLGSSRGTSCGNQNINVAVTLRAAIPNILSNYALDLLALYNFGQKLSNPAISNMHPRAKSTLEEFFDFFLLQGRDSSSSSDSATTPLSLSEQIHKRLLRCVITKTETAQAKMKALVIVQATAQNTLSPVATTSKASREFTVEYVPRPESQALVTKVSLEVGNLLFSLQSAGFCLAALVIYDIDIKWIDADSGEHHVQTIRPVYTDSLALFNRFTIREGGVAVTAPTIEHTDAAGRTAQIFFNIFEATEAQFSLSTNFFNLIFKMK